MLQEAEESPVLCSIRHRRVQANPALESQQFRPWQKPDSITALRAKRAELGGDIQAAATRIAQHHMEIAVSDVTLRVFDPEHCQTAIKTRLKRRGPAKFCTGELSRKILATLLQASAPVSVRDLAASVAAEHALDVAMPKPFKALVANVWTALS